MASERTFLIVKPDGVQRGLVGEILARWEKRGFKLVGMKLIHATKEQAAEHYAEHKERPFFGSLVEFLSSGPMVCLAYEGKGVVATSRMMIGATNPLASAPGTVRGDYGIEVDRNIIHGSDAVESANRELALWFKAEELLTWDLHAKVDIYH